MLKVWRVNSFIPFIKKTQSFSLSLGKSLFTHLPLLSSVICPTSRLVLFSLSCIWWLVCPVWGVLPWWLLTPFETCCWWTDHGTGMSGVIWEVCKDSGTQWGVCLMFSCPDDDDKGLTRHSCLLLPLTAGWCDGVFWMFNFPTKGLLPSISPGSSKREDNSSARLFPSTSMTDSAWNSWTNITSV